MSTVTSAELGAFLRARRQEIMPELNASYSGLRRVKGLRREEVARLAGVSADYYARLEQGRQQNISASVLSALASALQLNATQRTHLFTLAAGPGVRAPRYPAQSARRGLMRLLETVGEAPALLVGRGTDILAVNEAARAVFADFQAMPSTQRNVVRWFLLDARARRFDDWEDLARDLVGVLRFQHGRYPEDPRIGGLVAELSTSSEFFRTMWAEQYVAELPLRKTLRHPEAGTLSFDVESISSHGDRDQTVHLFMPMPGTGTAEAVAGLVADFRSGRWEERAAS